MKKPSPSSGQSELGDVASVDIDFVSGANDFFVLSRDRAAELGLPGLSSCSHSASAE